MAGSELVINSDGTEVETTGGNAPALRFGHVVTYSGRVSGVHSIGTTNPDEPPFTRTELVQLDRALTTATRYTGIRFTVYLGDLGTDTRAGVEELFPSTPEAENSVLIAVSPNERAIEILVGKQASDLVDDELAQLGVTAATGAFREGNIIDGFVAAIRVISNAVMTSIAP